LKVGVGYLGLIIKVDCYEMDNSREKKKKKKKNLGYLKKI